MDVAAGAQNLQASAFHGGEMRPARDEDHVGAGLCQRCTKSASDAAGTNNCNTHGFSLLLMSSVF
jgi:hypothetical protein